MIIYSELTKSRYSSVEECIAAEEAFKAEEAKKEAKKEEEHQVKLGRAQEIADAYAEILKAREHFNTLVKEYEKDFGKAYFGFQFGGTKVFPWF